VAASQPVPSIQDVILKPKWLAGGHAPSVQQALSARLAEAAAWREVFKQVRRESPAAYLKICGLTRRCGSARGRKGLANILRGSQRQRCSCPHSPNANREKSAGCRNGQP